MSFPFVARPIKGSSGGVNKDYSPTELPNNTFSDIINARFKSGKAKKILGHSQVYSSLTIAPYWLLPVPQLSNYYWLCAGLTKVHAVDGSGEYNVTRQTAAVDVDYNATADRNWTGGIMSGIPFLNNGVDDPQMWSPAQTSQKLTSLTYDASNTWNDMNYQCGALRAFRGFMFAMDVTKAGTNYPYMVKISTQAVPGAVPATWDESDTTADALELELPDAGGFVIDSLPMGNINVVYTESSAWRFEYIGGNDIFNYDRMFSEFGILSRRCVRPFKGKHLVLSHGDLILHDGRSHESIIDRRMQSWLSSNIDTDNYARSFMFNNYLNNEIWVCFPQQNSTLPDMALVWNYDDDQIGIAELPDAPHIGYGVVDPSENVTWDADADTWDNDASLWDARTYNPSQLKNLICDPTNTKLYLAEDTNQHDGTNYTARIERTGIPLSEDGFRRHIIELWPRLEGTGTVTITVGSHDTPDGAVSWGTGQTFTIGTDVKIDCWVEGYYGAFKIESTNNYSWEYSGHELVTKKGGKY